MSQFTEVEAKYKALRAQLEGGKLSQDQFVQQASQLMCQDDAGRWWTIHPESGMWHYHWRNEWRPGLPPGYAPASPRAVARPAAAPPPQVVQETVVAQPPAAAKGGGLPRWLIPAALALVLVSAVIIVMVWVVLPRLGGDQDAAVVTEATNTPLAATFTPQPPPTGTAEPTSQPTVTNTPEPTLTPSETPIPQGEDAAAARPPWPETLSDGFGATDSGWSRGAGASALVDYRDAGLRIELQGTTQMAWSRYEAQEFGDGWVEVTVRELASAAGIALHVTEDFYGYVFRIDSAGRYSIGRTLPDAEPPLVDWTLSDRIWTDGTPNRLAVLAEGDRYRFFVNGWLLHEVVDESHPFGLLALWGGSGENELAKITFDDALLLVGPEGAEPTPSETAAAPTAQPTPTNTKAAATPKPTATTAAGYPPLTFEVREANAYYPGSGSTYRIRFWIVAQGGNGVYTYEVAGQTFNTEVFEIEWGCGASFVNEIIVRSGDGQRASKNQYVQDVPCVP